MSDSDDIVKEFLAESRENLDRLDQELVELEQHPSDREILASIFRTIHSIKGSSGFLGFGKLESLTHVGESLLAALRDGQRTLTRERTTALLAMVDAVRQMLDSIETAGNEGERDDRRLIATLTSLLQPDAAEKISHGPPEPAMPASTPALGRMSIGDILISRGAATESEVSTAIAKQGAGDPRHVGEILVESGVVKPQEVLEALRVQQAQARDAGHESIRVNVRLLDQLMNQVGELVLARDQILQLIRTTDETSLLAAGQRDMTRYWPFRSPMIWLGGAS